MVKFHNICKRRKVDGLYNVFIHDTRNNEQTSTLIAKKGKIISGDSSTKLCWKMAHNNFNLMIKLPYFDKYLLDINQNQSDNLSQDGNRHLKELLTN